MNNIPRYIFDKSDAYDFAEMMNAVTKESGDELQFKYCPYCEGGESKDKYTFSINLNSGAYNCLRSSCERAGHFVQLARDKGFNLNFDNDYKPKEYRQLPNIKPKGPPANDVSEYFKKRCIGPETLKRYRVASRTDNPKIIVFPFYDENDKLTSIKYRRTDFDKAKHNNKEWFESNTKPILFGMSQCTDYDTLVITEGQIDSLSLAECGIKNAVSVPTGAKGFTWVENCYDWLCLFGRVIVFGDLEKGKMSLVDELSKRLPMQIYNVRHRDYLGEKDANDILCNYGVKAIHDCIESAERYCIPNIKDLSSVESVDIASLPRIKTGLKKVDDVLSGGFVKGQLIELMGETGSGKSTVASMIVANVLNQGEKVFIYTGELPDYHFKGWLDLQLAGPQYLNKPDSYGNCTVNDETVKAISEWYKGRAFIFDNDGGNNNVIDIIEQAIRQYGITFILVDNLMSAMGEIGSDLYTDQSNFVERLNTIAMKYDVIILLIVHTKKGVDAASYSNNDIMGSSNIANKGHVIMSYKRGEYDEIRKVGKGYIGITKNRLTGRITSKDGIETTYFPECKRIISTWDDMLLYGWEMPTKKEPANDSGVYKF